MAIMVEGGISTAAVADDTCTGGGEAMDATEVAAVADNWTAALGAVATDNNKSSPKLAQIVIWLTDWNAYPPARRRRV